MANPATVISQYLPRHAEVPLRTALSDTRIVAVVGPRQSGKTTLVQRVAHSVGMSFVTLDDDLSMRFAIDDPTGFVRSFPFAAIDEIQRAPGLILALKRTVDADPRPGRYIVTGSVDLFRQTVAPDSLAGRVETVPLFPFSQVEIDQTVVPAFVDRAFSADFPRFEAIGRTDRLVERVLAGGYPEAVARKSPARRRRWLRAYSEAVTRRDVAEVFRVWKQDQMARLVGRAAWFAGGLVNLARISSDLGVDAKTVDRWLTLLEHLFLVRRIRAWHRNDLKRLVKTPKLQFLDSGVLSALRRVGARAIARDRTKFGPLLESFVHAELVKAAGLSDDGLAVSHYRDKDGAEVDFVLERPDGLTVGIEVKSTATARPKDCHGLLRLKQACGSRFACGVLLHDGERVQEVAPQVFVMPLKVLWES